MDIQPHHGSGFVLRCGMEGTVLTQGHSVWDEGFQKEKEREGKEFKENLFEKYG